MLLWGRAFGILTKENKKGRKIMKMEYVVFDCKGNLRGNYPTKALAEKFFKMMIAGKDHEVRDADDVEPCIAKRLKGTRLVIF